MGCGEDWALWPFTSLRQIGHEPTESKVKQEAPEQGTAGGWGTFGEALGPTAAWGRRVVPVEGRRKPWSWVGWRAGVR